jgi:hypothetical protein
VAVGVAAALGAVAWLYLLDSPDRPGRARFERVVHGMTRDEVIAAVGGPPGDYRTDPTRYSISHPEHQTPVRREVDLRRRCA